MNLSKTEKDGTITVTAEGWLDGEASPQFRAYMETLGSCENLILDFEKLEYISSAGIREVVAVYRKQKESEKSFRIVNVSQEVADVFNMTGISKRIDVQQKV